MMNSANRTDRRRHRTLADELAAAVEYHRAGRLDRAEVVYRKVLHKEPGNFNALHLLGLAALNRGSAARAIHLISRALAIAPDLAEAHINLGNAQRAASRHTDAVASYERAIRLKPDLWDAHTNLALVLCEQGNPTAALAHAERAVELNPGHPDLLNNLATTSRALGRFAQAEAIARRAVQIGPNRADLYMNLANVLVDLRRFDEAAATYRRATELAPALAGPHYGLGKALYLTGDMHAALEAYRAALAHDGSLAVVWNDLGRVLRALGRFNEAIAAFEHALAMRPNFADAHRNLALCQRLPIHNAQIGRVEALVNDANLPTEDRITAGFALAKMLDDGNRFDEAFAILDRANSAYREARAQVGELFDADALRRQVNTTIARFTPAFFASVSGWGNPSQLPVYIVGMPRSGTSLVEQIVASHTNVFGAGERKDIGELAGQLGEAIQDWQCDSVRRLADAQLQRLAALGGDAIRVIDKLPDNVFMLGVIATLFPSARIIICTRDPLDIGLSCYFQKFSEEQQMFSYSLADCGVRLRETERLVAHWLDVLPLPMLDISYEKLVADLEGESRRLIDFLGLDWQARCLAFHEVQRVVQTASSWQVRQPLYTSSVGRWRCYKQHLGPLLAALDAEDRANAGGDC